MFFKTTPFCYIQANKARHCFLWLSLLHKGGQKEREEIYENRRKGGNGKTSLRLAVVATEAEQGSGIIDLSPSYAATGKTGASVRTLRSFRPK
jgi:hypothetical protein